MADQLAADDHTLQSGVVAAIERVLGDRSSGVGVAVVGGVALLSGELRSSADRARAVSAAQDVAGISTVHDAIVVRPDLSSLAPPTRADLTRAVCSAIAWAAVSPDSVRAEVWEGTVVLTGAVREDIEREDVCRAVRMVPGVLRVDDRIRVQAVGSRR